VRDLFDIELRIFNGTARWIDDLDSGFAFALFIYVVACGRECRLITGVDVRFRRGGSQRFA